MNNFIDPYEKSVDAFLAQFNDDDLYPNRLRHCIKINKLFKFFLLDEQYSSNRHEKSLFQY